MSVCCQLPGPVQPFCQLVPSAVAAEICSSSPAHHVDYHQITGGQFSTSTASPVVLGYELYIILSNKSCPKSTQHHAN